MVIDMGEYKNNRNLSPYHNPRDQLPQKRHRKQKSPEGLEIPGIELVGMVAVRRCIEPNKVDELYDSLGLRSSILPKVDVSPDELFEYPGATIGKSIKPGRNSRSKEDAFKKIFKLQNMCKKIDPLQVSVEGVAVFGSADSPYVSMVLDKESSKELKRESSDITRSGLRNQAQSYTIGHISLLQTHNYQAAEQMAWMLDEMVQNNAPLELTLGRPVLFSSMQPIAVDRDGVHPATLL